MRKYIFLCITLATLLSSCTEEINQTLDTKTSNNVFDLSENEAIAIARSFEKSVTSNLKTRTDNITMEVKNAYRLETSSKTRIASEENSPLVYEIEINDGKKDGKIIVSGDKRFPEVLAYIPSFNDSLYKISPEPNLMVQMSKNALLDKIQKYRNEPSTRSEAVDPVPGEVSVMIVPFCRTAWHQSYPYNKLLPKAWIEYVPGIGNRPGSSLYDNYNTGQAAVAIAQAMAYIQPYLTIEGTYIDWEALTTETWVTIPNQEMVSKLFKSIYNTIGTYPVWGKSYNDRWPQSIVDAVLAMETPIRNTLRALNSSQFGLTCDNDQAWNLNIVKQSLLSLNPVFVGDSNKVAFLVDGYAINEENEMYLHCNFGRSENFNGYYLVYDDGRVVFELNGYMYRDISLGIIANIKNR